MGALARAVLALLCIREFRPIAGAFAKPAKNVRGHEIAFDHMLSATVTKKVRAEGCASVLA